MIIVISKGENKKAVEIIAFEHNKEKKEVLFKAAATADLDGEEDEGFLRLQYAESGEKFTVIAGMMIIDTNNVIQTVQPGQQFHQ